MFGSNREYLKLQQETEKAKQDSIRERKNLLEDVIMTINQIQDVQAIKIEEKERNMMINSIINSKRSEYVDKIIELDHLCK